MAKNWTGRSAGSDAAESQDGVLPIEFVPDVPAIVGGKPNPQHYRNRAVNLNRVAEYHIRRGGAIPFNIESAMKMLTAEAEIAGINADGLADARTDEEKLSDWAELFSEGSTDAIFDALDRDIKLMEEGTRRVVDDAKRILAGWANGIEPGQIVLPDPSAKIPDDVGYTVRKARAEDVVRRGKAMLDRLRRIRRLQTNAREACPAREVEADRPEEPVGVNKYAWEATHMLRFMQYVGRSNMNHLYPDSDSRVYRFGLHHAVMACATWQAQNGVQFINNRILPGLKEYTMVVLTCPPGHGKSDFAAAWLGLEICRNPMTQAAYLHASADVAVEAIRPVAHMFTTAEASGRRRDVLFPGVNAVKKPTSSQFTVRTKEKQRNPTVRSASVMTARLGVSTDKQVWDDVVPQSDRDEPTVRARRADRLSGTWMTRQRGKKTFTMVVGTFWHKDDALMRLVEIAKRGGNIVVSIQKTGGPDTSPQFAPLWPEVYPAAELRARYEKMRRDKHLWACNYEANPTAEGARLIRKLRLYDPNTEEHREFLASAKMHVSVDPAATNREGKDKAGIVYAGVGEVTVRRPDGSVAYQNRLRVIEAEEIHVNQVEVVDRVAAFALQRPVYQVHVETKTGFAATADLFRDKYDLEVMSHEPGNRSKEIRLKQCASLIDDSADGYRAIVEFPGVPAADGSVVADPNLAWLYDEFLSFGATDHDHTVDAVTQLVNHLARSKELLVGSDEASRIVAAAMEKKVDPRLVDFFKKRQERASWTPETDEREWFGGAAGGRWDGWN